MSKYERICATCGGRWGEHYGQHCDVGEERRTPPRMFVEREERPVVTTILSTDKKLRKESPMARGVLDYFPRAIMAVANVSFVGNEQHNPGQPMHWAKDKSTDHADCILRHLAERGTVDNDGLRHTAKVAWRALALLETELEAQEQKQ